MRERVDPKVVTSLLYKYHFSKGIYRKKMFGGHLIGCIRWIIFYFTNRFRRIKL